MSTDFKLFISVPISSFSDPKASANFEASLHALIGSLRSRLPNRLIYCAAESVRSRGEYDSPALATETDLAALRQSTHLLFLYPTRVPTSALIELGYAIALDMPVLAVTANRENLPFMAQAFDEVLENFQVMELEILDRTTHPLIVDRIAALAVLSDASEESHVK